MPPGLAVAQPLVGHKSPSAGWTTGSLVKRNFKTKNVPPKVRFLMLDEQREWERQYLKPFQQSGGPT
jgi:hypothetical protein